jgi:uncharacterized protein YbjT (DUF2867 family)
MRIVVFGATGVVGRALLPELARTHEVVAVSRRPQEGEGVMWTEADVLDPDSVRRAVDGAEIVYYLVHSLGEGDFEERDAKAAESVAEEAGRAGVRQLVFLGGLGDDSAELSPHLRSRTETARRLASGGIPLTTIRAAVVVGAGSAAFETMVALVDRLPVMIAPRWVSMPTQPVALTDVVAYLGGVAGIEETFGESYDAGGPEVMTYREMVETVARLRGKRRAIVEVPLLTPRLSSLWLHLVTPVKAPVARPLVEGLSTATVAADDRIRRLVPIEPTPFVDAVRAALAERKDAGGRG